MFKMSNKTSLYDEGHAVLILECILATREKKLRTKVLLECLIQWKDFPLEDATWEGLEALQHPTLQLLWRNANQGGEITTDSDVGYWYFVWAIIIFLVIYFLFVNGFYDN